MQDGKTYKYFVKEEAIDLDTINDFKYFEYYVEKICIADNTNEEINIIYKLMSCKPIKFNK